MFEIRSQKAQFEHFLFNFYKLKKIKKSGLVPLWQVRWG